MSKKIILIAILASLIGAFFFFGLHDLLTLDYLKEKRQYVIDLYNQNPLLIGGTFFLIYIAFAALSLPAAALLTLFAGAIFGFWTGLILVSFASSIGATLAFLMARYVLRESMENKFSNQLKKINAGIEREGWMYCFTLRLIPVFPFFVVNIVLALTKLKTLTFYWSSQLGMFIATAIFVNAGTQLGKLETISGILSPKIIGSFVLLATFPFIAKFIMSKIKKTPTED